MGLRVVSLVVFLLLGPNAWRSNIFGESLSLPLYGQLTRDPHDEDQSETYSLQVPEVNIFIESEVVYH